MDTNDKDAADKKMKEDQAKMEADKKNAGSSATTTK